MAGFRPELAACPSCGAKGCCRIHAYYGRNIVDFIGGRQVPSEVTVTRVICGSCGHTHAILPDVIVPYDSYGIFFILRVLAERFFRKLSVEQVCERFSITRNQFYKWLRLWREHKAQWLGVLPSAETPDRRFMKSLVSMACFSDFAASFVRLTARSFLQSHRNPANYRRPPSGP